MSTKEKILNSSFDIGLCKILLITAAALYLGTLILPSAYMPNLSYFSKNPEPYSTASPTNLGHLVFGLIGSEKAVHYRKHYTQSWWRPGETRGYIYLDEAPKGDLLPWSNTLPSYRVSKNLTKFFEEIKPRAPIMHRMNYGILEVFNQEYDRGFRWLVMGDDDSVFFVDNMVDVLAKYDHTKYYYFGGQSEFIMSNYWFSFNQGFGGAGFIMSYPLAKALANGMEGCLRRSAHLSSADTITMSCIADIGVNLTPLQGIHQIDLHGDISGFLSSHPKAHTLSLHHIDTIDPIFPKMNRSESIRHLMKPAKFDQSRLLQQTICHQREKGWTISTAWGYSVLIYEKIMPRWWVQIPIETFKPWIPIKRDPPLYMFNTRRPFNDSCEMPHVFFFKSIEKVSEDVTLTSYDRYAPRGLPPCIDGNHTANFVTKIHVYSPATKLTQIDRCECCDIDLEEGGKEVKIKYRECMEDEIIAQKISTV